MSSRLRARPRRTVHPHRCVVVAAQRNTAIVRRARASEPVSPCTNTLDTIRCHRFRSLKSLAKTELRFANAIRLRVDHDPSVSSSLTRFFKALDAWAKRELSGMGELIELRKSRSFAAASGAGSSRAPCNVSSAAAASLLSALIWSLASRSLARLLFERLRLEPTASRSRRVVHRSVGQKRYSRRRATFFIGSKLIDIAILKNAGRKC